MRGHPVLVGSIHRFRARIAAGQVSIAMCMSLIDSSRRPWRSRVNRSTRQTRGCASVGLDWIKLADIVWVENWRYIERFGLFQPQLFDKTGSLWRRCMNCFYRRISCLVGKNKLRRIVPFFFFSFPHRPRGLIKSLLPQVAKHEVETYIISTL